MPVYKDHSFRLGASAQAGDDVYEISQSIRFDVGATPEMSRTHGTGGNTDLFTLSFWFKRGRLTTQVANDEMHIFGAGASTSNTFDIQFTKTDQIQVWDYQSAYITRLKTNRLFRDPSAWYHFVFVYDSGNAVSSERARMYINGVRETSFEEETYPSQNQNAILGTNVTTGFGNYISYGSKYYCGYLAEAHYINGYGYGPEYFGEFNSSGIWIPIDYNTNTGDYGSNGFFIDGRDSSDLGDDESGNGNDLTTSGLAAHDQVIDTPNNNFCVMSPIDKRYNSLSEGNLKTTGGTNNVGGRATMGFKSGKWYWEMYVNTNSDGYPDGGIVYPNYALGSNDFYGGGTAEGAGAAHNRERWYVQATSYTAYGSAPSSGDIYMYALDRDNNKIFWGVNGTWRNSGDPANGTGAVASSLTHYGDGTWMPFVAHGSNAGTSESTFNFGQEGTFAGATTAGGNSDANGIGNFKYSVPSGFLALCTRNLFTD